MRISNKISLWNLKWGERKENQEKNLHMKYNKNKK